MADCRTGSRGEVLTAVALGSCIGLAVYDAQTRIGGLLHFMLPDSAIDAVQALEKPFLFADTGIPLLLERLENLGASRKRLCAHAVGGAEMFEAGHGFEIGKRNCLAMRRILWKEGILLRTEAVGGCNSRTLHFEIATGKVRLQEGGVHRDLFAGNSLLRRM